jgi:predicted nucleotidyltransferase
MTPAHFQTETIFQEVIRLYESTFPGQIAAYYVEGSVADQTNLVTSDIDLVIVFSGQFAQENTRQIAEQLWNQNNQEMAVEVDITAIDEQQLQKGVQPNLKLGSQLIYGQDICSKYPLLPIADWARERMHASYWLTINIHPRPKPVQLPLIYPDEQNEFYGYLTRTFRLPNGKEVLCTRDLVRTVTWKATALLAHKARQYAVRKSQIAQLYHEYIGNEWSEYLAEIVYFCRNQHQYLIPEELEPRQQLRSLCAQTLQFEQHFLEVYKKFLLEELRSTDSEHARFAAWVQEKAPLNDEDVIVALETYH